MRGARFTVEAGLVAWFALCACSVPAGEPVAQLLDANTAVAITSFEVARAPADELSLEQALGRLDFRPTNGRPPNFGYTRDRLFARLTLENRTAQTEWMLRLGNPHLRQFHVFVRTPDGFRELATGGHERPASERAIRHRDFWLPIHLERGARVELVVQTDSAQWLGIIPEVATPEVAVQQRNVEVAVGLFGLGGVVMVLLYNLFLLVVTKDRTYLLYVLASVTTHLIAVPGATGALSFVFPHSPVLEVTVWHASAVAWLGFTALFTRALLVRDARHELERRALLWTSVIAFSGVVLPLFIGPHDGVAIAFNVITGLGQVLIFVVALRAAFVWRDPVARIFVAAWGVPLVAGGVFIVVSQGVAPVTDAVLYVMSGASVWEVVVMSLALGFRINLLQRDRAQAAKRLREANVELTRQIGERSVQLFSALRLVDEPVRWDVTLEAGTEINGRYVVERKVGQGAMGAVYVVRRRHDDGTRWAMKLATETRRETLARFAREAHIASLIRHENVVQIIDLDIAKSGFMFIVLELVEGPNLAEWAEGRAPVPLAQAVPILLDVARGLSALHQAGIAHRDLKPANVLLKPRDGGGWVAKLADFGVSYAGPESPTSAVRGSAPPPTTTDDPTIELKSAALAREGSPTPHPDDTNADRSPQSFELTKVGHVTGTPRYVAPELVLARSRDFVPADVYAFGVVAYWLITGTHPFPVLPFELSDDERSALRVAPVPSSAAAVEALLVRCLSLEPAQRPTAAALVADLEALGRTLSPVQNDAARVVASTP